MKAGPGGQLPLQIALREGATFDNFVPGGDRLALEAARQAASGAGERFLYLWGASGVGKSHLLQAACQAVSARGEGAFYLPLGEAGQWSPEMVEGLEGMALVAIDELDAVAGHEGWERALFHLYNRVRDGGGALLFGARVAPAGLGLGLADLASRLAWGLVIQLQGPDDAGKLEVLQQGARARGLELPEEVGNYLLRHHRRDLPGLLELLDRLDARSLAAQRRLTIPFVKETIESEHD